MELEKSQKFVIIIMEEERAGHYVSKILFR